MRKIIQAASIHLIWKLPVKIALIFLKIPASVTANLENLHEHNSQGCGHDHHHEDESGHNDNSACGCGHEHYHKGESGHDHDAACGCGHDHHVPGHADDCQCELCHPHEEYCDVCGESLENCICRMPDADCIKRVYALKNLGCANCAAKMEYKISRMAGSNTS